MFNYLLIIVIILLYYFYTREGFQNRDEKANAIYQWFTNNSDPKYSNYVSDLDSKSNIVEYEDVRSLFEQKNFTVNSIKNVI